MDLEEIGRARLNTADDNDIWEGFYRTEDGSIVTIKDGTGDNLLDEDRDKGYINYTVANVVSGNADIEEDEFYYYKEDWTFQDILDGYAEAGIVFVEKIQDLETVVNATMCEGAQQELRDLDFRIAVAERTLAILKEERTRQESEYNRLCDELDRTE